MAWSICGGMPQLANTDRTWQKRKQFSYFKKIFFPPLICYQYTEFGVASSKITNSEDTKSNKCSYLSGTCTLHRSTPGNIMAFAPACWQSRPLNVGNGPTRIDSCAIKGLTCTLERMNRGINYVHVYCTCKVHPSSAFYKIA